MRWPWSKSIETKSLTDPEDWLLAFFGGGGPTSSGIFVTIDQALRVPAVANAVKLISETAAALPIGVVSIGRDGIETPVPNHPIAKLLQNPNPWTCGSFELVRQIVADALTTDAGGMAAVTRVGDEPREIIRWKHGFIQADFSLPDGQPIYRVQGALQPIENIVHVRNSLDRAPVTLAREAIGVALAMSKHAGGLFGRGARPGGVLTTPKSLGDKGAQAMLAGWRLTQDGPDNGGRTAVLWDGASWSPMTLSSVDAQFVDTWGLMVLEIARAFNLPPTMVGEMKRATWANSEQMGAQFLVLCLEPWLKAVESAFNRALFPAEQQGQLSVRISRDDLTRADLGARATAYSQLIASRIVNPNTCRQWEGLPPYDGGDTYANPAISPGTPKADAKPPAQQAPDSNRPEPEDNSNAA